jgi:hypothetical protein
MPYSVSNAQMNGMSGAPTTTHPTFTPASGHSSSDFDPTKTQSTNVEVDGCISIWMANVVLADVLVVGPHVCQYGSIDGGQRIVPGLQPYYVTVVGHHDQLNPADNTTAADTCLEDAADPQPWVFWNVDGSGWERSRSPAT